MSFQPDKIKKEHVLKAVQLIDNGNVSPTPSTKYDVIINGRPYPPKDLMRLAHKEAVGEHLWSLGGGEPTNKYLIQMGFDVRQKNESINIATTLIRVYKERVRKNNNSEEIYKFNLIADFQHKWDIDTNDFPAMVKKINFSNLLYFNAIGVIRDLATRFPEETRSAFKLLYNEQGDLKDRIKTFQNKIAELYATVNEMHHHQDERTIATYLTFNNPTKYTFYKSSFYSKYCKLLNIKKAKAGERYIHYLQLIDQFIDDYIESDGELQQLHALYLQTANFKDKDFKILAQDILYQGLDLAEPESVSYFIAGSVWDKQDQLSRFLKEGIWENGHDGKNVEVVESVRPGSRIAIKAVHTQQKVNSVMTIKARGEVTENEEDGHILKVNWEEGFKPFVVDFSGGYWHTIHQITDKEHIKAIFDNNNHSDKLSNNFSMSKAPLNQILFGPPGTGKTYHTMNKALEIVGVDVSVLDRKSIKEEFERRAAEGQIVFTTFHQSMSYEDFIEGIKPNVDSDDSEAIKYKIEDGILKSLSRKAVAEYYKIGNSGNGDIKTTTDRLQLYDEAWNNLLQSVQMSLDNGSPLELKSLSNKVLDVIKITQQGNLVLKPRSTNAEDYTVSYLRTQKLFEAYSDLSQVKNIDKEFRKIIGGSNSTAYWCVVNYLNNWIDQKTPNSVLEVGAASINEALVRFDNQIVKANNTPNIKPYVLIIDEINRGNVSKVFGELITLIEKDKRLGNNEALEVILPYSKEKFGVPANLYIIGTMNTADRSVESLDTALRRRFSFEEIQPNSILLSPAHLFWKLLWDYKAATWEDENYSNKEKSLLDFLGAGEDLWEARKSIWDDMEKEGLSLNQVSYFSKYAFKGINLQLVLTNLNKRIEVLKDRDHQIGHAYFMHVYSVPDLMNVFKENIIPLLQEYFFGDYYKIQLVLGKGFIHSSSSQVEFAIEDDNEFEDKIVYSLRPEAFLSESNFIDALSDMKMPS